MAQEFTAPLAFNEGKLGDTFIIRALEETPRDHVLNIYNTDGGLLYGPVSYAESYNGYLYWYITASSGFGITDELSYYICEVSDSDGNDFATTLFVIYINDDVDYENYIIRSRGLAGFNFRHHDCVYTNGQLTQYDVSLYATAQEVNNAQDGQSVTPLASYRVTISYNSIYNQTTKTVTRTS